MSMLERSRNVDDNWMPGVSGNAAQADPNAPVLEAVNLRKAFPLRRLRVWGPAREVKAVEDVSLALRPGRSTALVGESGSGKTTVARILARLYGYTSGEMRFRGQRISRSNTWGLRQYRRYVQLIFQDPFSSLNPVHTVHHHLCRPLRIHGHARTAAEVDQQVRTLLERVNLTPADHFMRKYPHELSGGQRQRVAIARALAARPEVLLADEPVSMLDVSIRLDVLNLLRRLKEEDRLALLYITHDIASARYFADETLVMYAGQMVEGGPSEVVTQQPKHPYTRLLLQSAPDPDRMLSGAPEVEAPLVAKGEPPSLITPPSGCRFHPRCPSAMDVCRQAFPPRTDLGGGHWTHCYLYGENASVAAQSAP